MLGLGYTVSKYMDRGIIELLGPTGTQKALYQGSQDIQKLDQGNVQNYALIIAISMISLTFLVFQANFNILLDIRILLVLSISLFIIP